MAWKSVIDVNIRMRRELKDLADVHTRLVEHIRAAQQAAGALNSCAIEGDDEGMALHEEVMVEHRQAIDHIVWLVDLRVKESDGMSNKQEGF